MIKIFLKAQLQKIHNLHHNYSIVKELTQVPFCIFKATRVWKETHAQKDQSPHETEFLEPDDSYHLH